jgi:hypothetical protein
MTYIASESARHSLTRPARISTPALAPSTTFTGSKPAPTTLCCTNRSIPAIPANSNTSMTSHTLEYMLCTCASQNNHIRSNLRTPDAGRSHPRLYMIAITDPQLDNSQPSRNVPCKALRLGTHEGLDLVVSLVHVARACSDNSKSLADEQGLSNGGF